MPRTLTDAEAAQYDRDQQTLRVIQQVWDDPALNREAKALLKKKFPNVQIPDYDIMQQVEQRFATERQEREDRENQRRQQEEEADFNQKRSATQKKYGLTDEGMTELEKMMLERNIGDYEVAASYHVSQNPKPSDATFDDMRWNHSKQEGFADIVKDPEAWGRAEIMKALHNDQERAKNQRF